MELLTLNIEGKEPPPPTEGETRVRASLTAAIATLAVGLLLRFSVGAPLLPELMSDFVFAIAPIQLVEFSVSLLGLFAKQLAFIGCAAAYVISLAALTGVLLSFKRISLSFRLPLSSLFALAMTLFAVIPILGGGVLGESLRQGVIFTSVSLFAGHAAHYATLVLTMGRPGRGRVQQAAQRMSRRTVLRWAGAALVAIAFYDMAVSIIAAWRQSGAGRVKNGDGVFPNINGLALEVTPTDDFYQVSKNPFDPVVDERSWRLEVTGMVESSLRLTYHDLKSLPSVEQYATLECISNEVGGNLIGTAVWRGIKLKTLLVRAGLKAGVVDVVLRAGDGYSDSIPLDRALADSTLLAYEMNGAPLSPVHGFPLRLIVPGIFGMKNVKWITGIEAVDVDFKGYWQRRGWDDRAEYKTMSRIDVPVSKTAGQTTIAGVAFAGDRGVTRIEVSTDGGSHWESAVIRPPLSRFTWVLWHKLWDDPAPGQHRLLVRTVDGTGTTQTGYASSPIPSGATGYHSRVVRVESQQDN